MCVGLFHQRPRDNKGSSRRRTPAAENNAFATAGATAADVDGVVVARVVDQTLGHADYSPNYQRLLEHGALARKVTAADADEVALEVRVDGLRAPAWAS